MKKLLIFILILIILIANKNLLFKKENIENTEDIITAVTFETEEERIKYIHEYAKPPEGYLTISENEIDVSGGTDTFHIKGIEFLYEKYPIQIAVAIDEELTKTIQSLQELIKNKNLSHHYGIVSDEDYTRFVEQINSIKKDTLNYAQITLLENKGSHVPLSIDIYYENTQLNFEVDIMITINNATNKIKVHQYWLDYSTATKSPLDTFHIGLVNLFTMLNSGELEKAYNFLNKEYLSIFSMNFNRFKAYYTYDEPMTFIVKELTSTSNSLVGKVNIIPRSQLFQPTPQKIERTFTFFVKDNKVTFADKGLYSINPVNIDIVQKGIKVKINYIINSNEGIYLQMEFLNENNSVINITDIIGKSDNAYYNHYIDNFTFLDFELKPNRPRRNLVLLKFASKINSVEIYLDNNDTIILPFEKWN